MTRIWRTFVRLLNGAVVGVASSVAVVIGAVAIGSTFSTPLTVPGVVSVWPAVAGVASAASFAPNLGGMVVVAGAGALV